MSGFDPYKLLKKQQPEPHPFDINKLPKTGRPGKVDMPGYGASTNTLQLPMSGTVTPQVIKPVALTQQSTDLLVNPAKAYQMPDGVTKSLGKNGSTLYQLPSKPQSELQTGATTSLPAVQSTGLPAPQAKAATPAQAQPLPLPQQAQPQQIFRPVQVQADPAVLEARNRAIELSGKDMTSGANRIQAKYANALLNELLPNDVQNQGLQQKTSEQAQQAMEHGQELGEKKRQADMTNYQALLEGNQKSKYYDSEAALNNEKLRQSQLPQPPAPEKWSNTTDAAGNPIQVSDSGFQRSPKLLPADELQARQADYAKTRAGLTDPEQIKQLDTEHQTHIDRLKKLAGG